METKQKKYDELLPQVAALIEGEKEEMSVLANVSAALKECFGWFWTGFYMEREGELRLGPFQGTVACMHIAHGRGVCGTGEPVGVLDIDSTETAAFDDTDRRNLEQLCLLLSRNLYNQ